MLRELYVENVALIERAQVAFGPGFNVLTGETGAGKSLILDALGMALGQRASAELVRSGAEVARVDAMWELAPGSPAAGRLAEVGLGAEDGQWVLSREITRAGRSRARINGRPVSASELAQAGELLVDLHTQHESQKLLRPGVQLELLDAYAGQQALELRRAVAERWRRLEGLRAQLQALVEGERRRLQEMDLLAFQVQEIEAAALREGEEAELASEHGRLAHAGRLQGLLGQAHDLLSGGSGGAGAADRLGQALQLVQQAGQMDAEAQELAASLAALQSELAHLARRVRRLAERCEPNPQRLQEVEQRLALMDRLKRKYGADVAAVLAFAHQARARLAELGEAEARGGRIRQELEALEREFEALSERLSAQRAQAARALAGAVERELADLAMPHARFEVALSPAEPGPWGRDAVEFRFSATAAEPPRPLARVASGGELSRTMLACRTVLAGADPVGVLVFDEPDAGIGGRAAQAVGERLARLGRHRQVLVVTHLPQVASLADHHLAVVKVEENGHARVEVRQLTGAERVAELARMLGGSRVTETALRHAEALLHLAEQARTAG